MSLIMRFGEPPRRQIGLFDTRIRAALRQCIADEVERLVDLLDTLEPDPDFEPELPEDDAGDDREMDEDREPAFGWTDHENQASPQRHGDGSRWGEDEL